MTFFLGSLQLRAALEMQGLQGWKLAAWQHGPQRAEALLPVLEPRPLLPRSQPGAGRRGQDGRACAAAVGRSPLRSCCAPCVAAGSSVLGVEGRRGGGGRSREGADGTGGGLRAHSGPAWARAGRGWQGPGGGRLAQAAVVLVASPGRVVALGGSPGWKLVRGHCGVTRECGCGGLSPKRAGGLCGPGGLRDRARESGARSAPGEWALLSARRWVPGVQFEVPVGPGVGVLGRDVWVRRELRNSGT